MKFWLIVFLFTTDGDYLGKDIYAAADKSQCIEFAGQVAKVLVNSQLSSQMYCVSDDHYTGRALDENIALD
jgi:hypothetical protein